jgi:ribose 1,5-bisphosphokinase PhnN
MNRMLVYLVGEPGSGKTTAMRALTVGYARSEVSVGGCPFMRLERPTCAPYGPDPLPGLPLTIMELGRDREGHFGGTDALAMNISPKAIAAMGLLHPGLVLAEGDRLAHDRFLGACEDQGWTVHVAALATPPQVAAERRAERGTGQNETWVRGRRTKAVALAQRWGAARIDGTGSPEAVAATLREQIIAWNPTKGLSNT